MRHGEIEPGTVSAGLAAGHDFLKDCHADLSTPAGKSRRYQKMLASGKPGGIETTERPPLDPTGSAPVEAPSLGVMTMAEY